MLLQFCDLDDFKDIFDLNVKTQTFFFVTRSLSVLRVSSGLDVFAIVSGQSYKKGMGDAIRSLYTPRRPVLG